MSAFFTDSTKIFDEKLENGENLQKTTSNDIDFIYELDRCCDWIETNGYGKICLQFPDNLLPDATEIALRLQKRLKKIVYILADTAYERCVFNVNSIANFQKIVSCCIDYDGAAHIGADAILHFGPVCFSENDNRLPHLLIYEKFQMDYDDFLGKILEKFPEKPTIVPDAPYWHHVDNLQTLLREHQQMAFKSVKQLQSNMDCVIFLGENARKLMNIYFSFKPEKLYWYDPKLCGAISLYEPDLRVLKRRSYLIEKIKEAATVGIVIAALSVRGRQKIVERLKHLLRSTRKKYYILSVGRPNVAKLANFPELDVYCVIACASNAIYDMRDFYKPIVAPCDIEMALNSNINTTNSIFNYDFNSLLEHPIDVTTNGEHNDRDNLSTINTLATKMTGTVACTSKYGAGFLADKTWRGLEEKLGESDVRLAELGRNGVAQGYQDEGT